MKMTNKRALVAVIPNWKNETKKIRTKKKKIIKRKKEHKDVQIESRTLFHQLLN